MLSPQAQSHAAIRKGAKSCTECRRRKVRCVRIPDDAQTCRQCQERGTACLAQMASLRPRQTQRLPSRLRIAQLEAQVSHLTKIVNVIEVKLGGKPSARIDSALAHDLEAEDSEGEYSDSDILAAEEPSHLRSLFQNDWLSVDTDRHDEQQRGRRAKASAHLLDAARPELQKLIPTKEETRDIIMSTYDWLSMLQLMLPQPFAAKSQQEMMENYDEISQPNVDIIRMTTWLLELAITALQVPQGSDIPESDFRIIQRRLGFSRAVSEAVEKTILAHDRLLGTLEGLGIALHFIRLQIGHGNVQKAWVRLRHIIAITELMGLPKTLQLFRLKKFGASINDETLALKAQLWESICSVDRLLGMVINLPPDTRRYPHTTSLDLVVDGVVQPRVYLSQLTEIAAKIHDLEYMNTTHEPCTKLYALALDIAREVRDLGSRTPASWWVHDAMDDLRADHVVQMLHYCVIMRAYLPLALRRDHGEEYLHGRLACMDACTSVAQRYQFVRRKLAPGMFASRMLDLQAFTASVVLLLTSHSWPSMDQNSILIDKSRLEGIVSQVIELMRERSKDRVGSDFAEHGMRTLCALNKLLRQEDDVAHVHELTLNIPLLGKMHIRSNIVTAQAPGPTTQLHSGVPVDSQPWKPQGQTSLPVQGQSSINTDPYMHDTIQTGSDWQWNNLSWIIEEDANSNFFEDPLAWENFDQPTVWQNPYYSIPLAADMPNSRIFQ